MKLSELKHPAWLEYMKRTAIPKDQLIRCALVHYDGFDTGAKAVMVEAEYLVTAIKSAKINCACNARERLSGHLTNCLVPLMDEQLARWTEFVSDERGG